MRATGKKLISDFMNPVSVSVFSKSLYVYFLFKIGLSWPVVLKILAYKPVTVSSFIGSIVFSPALLVDRYPQVCLSFFVLVLLVSVFIRHNYFSAIIIFWIAAGLYKITLPIGNGSDLVLMLLLLFNIFLARYPTFSNSSGLSLTQIAIGNATAVLCRVQICFIYLLSGWDKLLSDMWRAGEAVQAIIHIDYLVNPAFSIQLNKPFAVVIAWSVILFELLFPFFVWIEKSRLWMLAAGVIFHLLIAFFLSLPDFGLIMIIAYLIFLEDEDYQRIRARFRLSPL